MLLSGAVAGLVGMPQLLGGDATQLQPRLPGRPRLHRHRDRPARPQQPGRHRASPRCCWAFLDSSALILDLDGISKEIVLDHAGHHRARPSSSPTSWSAATASSRSSAGSAASSRPTAPAEPAEVARMSLHQQGCPATGRHRRKQRRIPTSGAWFVLMALGLLVVPARRRPRHHRRRRPHLQRHRQRRARAAVPIGLAGLGGLWSERAGVVNIGLEGMMILGTWGAGWAAYQWGPWTGVLVGIALRRARRPAARASPPSPSASTTSSPVSRSTSSALGVTQYLSGRRVRRRARAAASRSRRRSPTSATVSVPGLSDSLLDAARTSTGSSSPTSPACSAACSPGVSLLTVVAVAAARR